MRFEWDEAKRRENLRKHGVDFPAVVGAFRQPGVRIVDDRRDYGEPRFVWIAEFGQGPLAIAYTVRRDAIRIISARPASRRERQHLAQGDGPG